MKQFLYLSLIILFSSQVSTAQNFSSQQKAWLYRITQKTPSLQRNWGNYFNYTKAIPTSNANLGFTPDFDILEQRIINSPNDLIIDWSAISQTSPGLIAEGAVKLALWELYSNLKEGSTEEPAFSVNTIAKEFYMTMIKNLPADFRDRLKIKEKYQPLVYSLINPSLSLAKKANALEESKRVSAIQEKQILERWHKMVKTFVEKKSLNYFIALGGDKDYFGGKLLAVGEGSGSAGLLYEYENIIHNDQKIVAGKGVGLFTYEMVIKKEQLIPKYETSTKIKPFTDVPTLLHLSLWGLNSTLKPLIVIENGAHSYLLFADGISFEISPDTAFNKGISYLDRINQIEELKIVKPLTDLNRDGGLLSIFDRESQIEKKINDQINSYELEIDSILKLEDQNTEAIDNRKRKIESLLSNQTKKRARLSELSSKIDAEYKKIEASRTKVETMKEALGKEPQSWVLQDSLYLFKDGVIFNQHTQDLILPKNSATHQISIKLLAASFTFGGTKKDEVQLYVNTTNGIDHTMTASHSSEINRNKKSLPQQEVYHHTFYFEPDAFDCGCKLPEQDNDFFKEISNEIQSNKMTLKVNLIAMGVDSLNFPCIKGTESCQKTYKNGLENAPQFKNARRVDISIIKKESNEYVLNILGYTDAIPSRLSKLSIEERKHLKKYQEKKQKQNPILSALRVLYALKEIERLTGLILTENNIILAPNNSTIKTSDIIQ